MIQWMLTIWFLVLLAFLNPAWTSGSSWFTLLKPGLENFEHYFASVWDECNCVVVWAFFVCKEYNQSDFGVDHLVMSMCRVLLLCCWKRVFAMISASSWENSITLCPASFCTPKANFPVTPGISCLPIFAFQPPVMKRTSFLGVSSRRSCRSS